MKNLILLLPLGVMIACGQPVGKDTVADQKLDSIQTLESRILKSGEALKPSDGIELESMMVRYAHQYPEDSISPYLLLKAGNVARNIPDRGLESIRYYEETFARYTDHPVAAPALFFRALTYDEILGNKERAASTMNEFLRNFPDHRLADQGRELIKIYQDTTDEIDQVKAWLENADTTSQEP